MAKIILQALIPITKPIRTRLAKILANEFLSHRIGIAVTCYQAGNNRKEFGKGVAIKTRFKDIITT